MAHAVKTLCLALVALAAMLMLSAQSASSGSWAQAAESLNESIRELQNRVERLEAVAARANPAYLDGAIVEEVEVDAAPGRDTPTRIMRLEGIETVEPDPDAYDEIDRLKTEVDALERTVNSSQQRVNSMQGGYSSGYRGRSSKNTSESRQRRAESESLAGYQQKLRQKRGEMARLERELAEPKQLIIGRMGNRVITLETTRDMTRQLDKVVLGDYITWEGRRVSANSSSQEWVVTSIQPAPAPQ